MTQADTTFRYVTNASMTELADRIRQAQRIMVTTHARPDGDAMGSVLAIGRTLRGMGKDADIHLMGPIEKGLKSIIGETPVQMVDNREPDDDYDLIIVTDTGSWAQLDRLADWLRSRRERIIGFDHHVQGEDVAARRIVDPEKASATELLVGLMDELGVELTGEIGGVAEALFVGLATDTGWFKFQNADADSFAVAARLLATGVDKSRLYQLIEESAEPARLALEARALQSVMFARNDEVAIMSLSRRDFDETGGSQEELTGVVNLPMQVGTVRISILLSEVKPDLTKISFRAKPATADEPFTDVNLLARKFGGGGHPHAAGAKVPVGLDEARQAVIGAVEQG